MTAAILALFLLQTPAAAPRGAISGVVARVGNPSEERLPDARVELFRGPGTPLVTRTDGGGKFAFADLLPGVYEARVMRDGYVREEGAITLAAGQQRNDLRFVLRPASSLAGAVIDEYGEPVSNALIQALGLHYDPMGNPILAPEFSTLVDDRGQYRLYWVDPGAYYISASVTPDVVEFTGMPVKPPNPNAGPISRSYAPVFYPGVADPAGLEPLHVGSGEEANGIDMRLIPDATVALRGHVFSPAGEDAFVRLIPAGSVVTALLRLVPARGGAFEIQGVTPGTYILAAETASGHRGSMRIDVRDQDVNNLTIALQPPRPVSGQMYVASGPAPDTRLIRIRLLPLEAGLAPPAPAPIQTGGVFGFDSVMSGGYLIALDGLPGESYLSAARFGQNTSILEEGVILAGAPAPIEIVIGTDGGRVQGMTAPGVRVVLVPNAERRRPDLVRVVDSDAKGEFTIHGIAPGDYMLFAWERVEPNAYLNATFLARYAEKSVPVHVESGATLTANVTAIRAAESGTAP
ncbi:MAG TPA: carboxypeptidase regulatory-like domain-containing protein [Terriglobia bacterium]|nr:carboxypeptidase regulatory-like domain-containing protein [Terriglobia bacterium]